MSGMSGRSGRVEAIRMESLVNVASATPEQRLTGAVIAQAINDAIGHVSTPGLSPKAIAAIKAEARAWLATDAPLWLSVVCPRHIDPCDAQARILTLLARHDAHLRGWTERTA